MTSDRSITRPQHPKVRWLRALAKGKQRREERVAVAEGIKPIAELVEREVPVSHLFYCEALRGRPGGRDLLEACEAAGTELVLLDERVLDGVADTRTSQGAIAVVACQPDELSALLAGSGDVVVLDGVQDPGNVGTVIRSAAAAGACGVILAGECADPTAPKVVRAAAGALWALPWTCWNGDPESLAGHLCESDRAIAVADGWGDNSPLELPKERPLAWVLGGEAKGVSPVFRERAEFRVAIPMDRGVESLNVAAAGAILLFARRLSG